MLFPSPFNTGLEVSPGKKFRACFSVKILYVVQCKVYYKLKLIISKSNSLSLELPEVPDEVRDSESVPVGLGGVGGPDALLGRPQHLRRHAALPASRVPSPLLLLISVARLEGKGWNCILAL